MAKEYLPIEAPEELWIIGYGAEDDDYAHECKKDNLDTAAVLDPKDPSDMETLYELTNGHLVFKYKLVSVGKIHNTTTVKWNK